jgi:S1-C subfamily serine protease
VNTAIIAMAQGLGFAVPSNTAQWVTNDFMTYGRVRRRQLGIVASSERLPRAIVREFDLLSDQVVHVVEVAQNSVAEQSGIEAGDFLVSINDRIISGVDDIHRLLSMAPLEMPLDLTLFRRGRKFEARISWN